MELKVKRGNLAKEFPLIKVAKHGDVGFDIPVALPQIATEADHEVNRYLALCNKAGVIPQREIIDMLLKDNVPEHEFVTIHPGERYLLPTDIRVELPDGYWASIEARSSTSKQSLIVPKGVIDEGYRGELFAQIINVGTKPVVIHHGDRLIQMIIHKNYANDFTVVEVDELSDSERGESGFGSSGQSAYTTDKGE